MQTGIAIAQRASGQARNQIIFLCLNPHSVALGFEMSNARAVRYRRLALAEEDKAKADLLLKQPPNARDAKARFEWDPHD
jgi:hypothetical protein